MFWILFSTIFLQMFSCSKGRWSILLTRESEDELSEADEIVEDLTNNGQDSADEITEQMEKIEELIVNHDLDELTKMLEENRFNLNFSCRYGASTPLNQAILKASSAVDIKIVELLICHGADVNYPSSLTGNMPLIMVSESEVGVDILNLLLQHGADVNVKNNQDVTPLIYAAMSNNSDVFQILVKREDIDINCHTNTKGRTALIYLTMNDNEDSLKLLLAKEHLDINATDIFGRTALMYAAKSDKRVIQLLLQQDGLDVYALDENNERAWELAIFSFSFHALEKLAPFADEEDLQNALSICLKFDVEELRYLAELLFNKLGGTCKINFLRFDSIKGLFELTKDPNLTGKNGLTLLMAAAVYRDIELLGLLIDSGADIDRVDIHGNTVLFYAISSSDAFVVNMLLHFGANIDSLSERWLRLHAAKRADEELRRVINRILAKRLVNSML